MKTLKAGCFLIDAKNKSIALVYRAKQNDYTFPKGHVEEGEEKKFAAIRETAEETKREPLIIDELEPYIDEYTTSSGIDCICYMYFALDGGKSDNASLDTHDLVWTSYDKVEEILSYPTLKQIWNEVKGKIIKIIEGNR